MDDETYFYKQLMTDQKKLTCLTLVLTVMLLLTGARNKVMVERIFLPLSAFIPCVTPEHSQNG